MHTIRRALPQDALGIHQAHMRSIQEVCSRDHSAEEIKGWGHRPYREEQRLNAINNQFVWVVERNGVIEGYAHLALIADSSPVSAHVFGLYLTKEANGHGLGISLLDLMLKEASAHDAKEIALESTLTAYPFYKKHGFTESGPESSLNIGGSQVRYVPMRKILY